jgi:hypothetical protein
MHAGWLGRSAVVVGLVGAIGVPPAGAQEATLDQRLAVVRTAAAGTPEGRGLLPTALAEARVAVVEARRAAEAADLATQQAHARGVIHAIDPGRVGAGPGLGYGLRRAVAEIAAQLAPAAGADAPDVATLLPRALAAAAQVQTWSDALIAAAERILAARQAPGTAEREALARLAAQLTTGVDADGDGQVTFAPGEAGLRHLGLSLRALAGSRAGRVHPPEAVR